MNVESVGREIEAARGPGRGEDPSDGVLHALPSRYVARRRVGAGASAVVYAVADKWADGEIRAAKFTRFGEGAEEAERAAALRAEFGMAARFVHPNLVRYLALDFPVGGSTAVTIMEFVEGRPLDCKSTGDDTALKAALILRLLGALNVLHEDGSVHGDIKPGNVLWHRQGEEVSLKLLDYHLVHRPRADATTTPRGTLLYLAPEVISGAACDPRSDLYAVGALLYELLTGAPPFTGTTREIVTQALTAPVTWPEAKVPARIRQVVDRLLSKRPEGRHAGAEEAMRDIADAAAIPTPTLATEALSQRAREAPFVGRESEMRVCQEVIATPNGSPRRALLIRGASGTGKSRLLREVDVLAQVAGAETILLTDRNAAGGLSDELLRRLLPEKQRSRAAGHTPPSEAQGALDAETLARLERCAEELLHRAQQRKVMILVDGLDRPGTRGVDEFAFLLRATTTESVVYATVLDAPTSSELPLSLRSSIVAGVAKDIVLDALPATEARQLLHRILRKPTRHVVEVVAEECGGFPSTLCDVAERLLSSPESWNDATRARQSVRDHLQQHTGRQLDGVRALPASVRSVVELLATLGADVELERLAETVGLSTAALRERIEQSEAGRFVAFRQTGSGVLCGFARGGPDRAILDALSADRRTELHDAAAQFLLEGRESASPATRVPITRHRLLGSSPGRGVADALELVENAAAHPNPKALMELFGDAIVRADGTQRARLLEGAGDAALAVGLPSRAVESLAQAVREPGVGPVQHVRLRRKLANALLHDSKPTRAREEALAVIATCASCGPAGDREEALARITLASIHRDETRLAEALEECVRAKQTAERLRDDDLKVSALMLEGSIQTQNQHHEEGIAALIRAWWLCRRRGDHRREAAIPLGIGLAALGLQRWRPATSILTRLAPQLRARGRLADAAAAYAHLGASSIMRACYEEAEPNYREAIEIYARLGMDRWRAVSLVNLAHAEAYQGKFESAISHAEEARSVRFEDQALRSMVMIRLVATLYTMGDAGRALEVCEVTLASSEASRLTSAAEFAHRLLGEIQGLRKEYDAAERHLHEALLLARRMCSTQLQVVAHARMAELAVAQGDVRGARTHLGHAQALCARGVPETARAVVNAISGKLELACGNIDEALGRLHQAEVFQSKARICGELMALSYDLGQAYTARGQQRFAAYYFRTALDMVEQVVAAMRDERNKAIFLSDPRRVALFAAIREASPSLRAEALSRKAD